MQMRNWLDLSRKLVDRYDMSFSFQSVQAALGEAALSYWGEGVLITTTYLNPFPVSLSAVALGGTVGNGIAYDPNGQITRIDSASPTSKNFTLTASDPANPRWDLLVIRYVSTGDTPIPQPSDPILTIDLNLHDDFELAVIPGTPSATPDYPEKGALDIILGGIRVPAGATLGTDCAFDQIPREMALAGIFNYPTFQQETIAGTGTDFTLSKLPLNASSVILTVDGIKLLQSEYTLIGQDVTLDVGVEEGQVFGAWYIVNNSSSENPLTGLQEIPSGAVDGANTTFSLAGRPIDQYSTLVFIDGTKLEESEWSLSIGVTCEVVTNTPPARGQKIEVFYLQNIFTTSGGGGGGSASGANIGSGSGVYAALSGSVLQFRTLVPGSGIEISEDSDEITISSSLGIYGSPGAPVSFDPTIGLEIGAEMEQIYCLATGGGVEVVTSAIQIQAGSVVGQRVKLRGADAVNYYTFQGVAGADNNGISANGDCDITNNQCLILYWDGVVWYEENRRM